jgi:hypothetical protein
VHGCALVIATLWRRYGRRVPILLGWAMTAVLGLLTGVIFRAGSIEAMGRIYEGLAILPDLNGIARAAPIMIAALCAVALPASQDIAARLNARPRVAIAAALGLAFAAVLVELGDREAYEFVYFQF